jgi:uncharacterized protein (UPF0548 family)
VTSGDGATLTYREVGFTAPGVELPGGYRQVVRRRRVGTDPAAFAALADAMRGFGVHRRAGLVVRADGPPVVGATFATGIGVGPVRLWVPCKFVWVRDEPGCYGYGFGTLPGHPERGEEAFIATLADDGTVWFELRVFSQHVAWYARAAGPLATFVQDRATARYLRAAARCAASG